MGDSRSSNIPMKYIPSGRFIILSTCLTAVLYILSILLVFSDNLFAAPAYSNTKIRVLITDGKRFKQPSKGEKVERLGNAKGEAFIEGLKYKGSIEVWRGEKGLYVINEIPFEEYIKGVVAGEMGSSWDIEALKAQAVAARTYALYQMKNGAQQRPLKYHLTSSVLHQVYKGVQVAESIVRAVDETKGEAILYEGKPIIAYYHSTSGGMTEEASEVFSKEFPYLKPQETSSELSPYHIWERKIPLSEVEGALQIKGIKDISIESYTTSNRARDLRIVLEDKDAFYPAKDIRRLLGWDRLPSTLITELTKDNDSIIFEGRGYGHGVGMCQWTALDMAKKGKSYKEILLFFYPGTSIEVYEDK